ncbi:MAG: Holliday junction branch migration protein RuvA [Ruminococcaceae bacterium]|nr:Holliday junction branch migration protein RuvA [Oscillospiraceae bacterium]
MIYCLTGEILYLNATAMTAVIDCAGVGYKLTVSGNTMSRLSAAGEGVHTRVFTYMSVREDAVDLYGLDSPEELEIFKLLIKVDGVGPKAANSILSVLSCQELIYAIVSEDAKAISRAPGVGAKTAAKVILELHDKIEKNFFTGAPVIQKKGAVSEKGIAAKGNLSDAKDALLVLGYSKAEITQALAKADSHSPTEDIIRDALAILMR